MHFVRAANGVQATNKNMNRDQCVFSAVHRKTLGTQREVYLAEKTQKQEARAKV